MTWWDVYVAPVLTHLQHPPIVGVIAVFLSLRWTPAGAPITSILFSIVCGLTFVLIISPAAMLWLEVYSLFGQLMSSLIVGLVAPDLVIKTVDYVKKTDLQSLLIDGISLFWRGMDFMQKLRK